MPNNVPYDPCGHTKLAVSDYKKSYIFYSNLFAELKYKQVSNKDHSAGWASPDGYGILIAQAKIPDYQYRHDSPGIHHVCFKAESPERVDQVHQFLVQKKAFIFNAPKKHPEFTDKYYNVLFADPDGIKLEVAYY